MLLRGVSMEADTLKLHLFYQKYTKFHIELFPLIVSVWCCSAGRDFADIDDYSITYALLVPYHAHRFSWSLPTKCSKKFEQYFYATFSRRHHERFFFRFFARQNALKSYKPPCPTKWHFYRYNWWQFDCKKYTKTETHMPLPDRITTSPTGLLKF